MNMNNKNYLRPIKFKADYNIASKYGLEANKEYTGWMLGFWHATPPAVTSMLALIELSDGRVIYIPAERITFTDRKPEEEANEN